MKKCSEHVLPDPSMKEGPASSVQGLAILSQGAALWLGKKPHAVPDISFLHKGLSCQIFPLLVARVVWLGFPIPLLACGPSSGGWVDQPVARHRQEPLGVLFWLALLAEALISYSIGKSSLTSGK